MRKAVSIGALAVLVLAGCGEPEPQARGPGAEPEEPTGEQIARATVLEDRSHGPQLCLGGVMESYPPQCGGPELVGWDWDAVVGAEESHGTRWGEYVVIGHFDPAAESLTLTRPAVPADQYDGPGLPEQVEESVWSTPCDEPDGGWQVVDSSLATQKAMDRTIQIASTLPDYGSLWLDQSINPALNNRDETDDEWLANDPAKLILNVAVAGDPEAAEQKLRETWGGALCVSTVEHTERELLRVQEEVRSLPGMLTSAVQNDRVEVGVVWDDGSLQRRLDEEHGDGLVVVVTALQPFGS